MAGGGTAADTPETITEETRKVLREASAAGRGPAVTVSWAQSRDGAIAAAGGVRAPLSCPESLALTHRLRALHSAILVGIGTVLSDDPLLSVRLAAGPQPQPVVLDTHLRFPLSARLLAREDMRPWIFHAGPPGERGRDLEGRGARLFAVPRASGGLDLREVLAVLADQGIGSLMVEGGAHVLRSFLGRGLASQAVITICPFTLDGLRVLERNPDAAALPDLADGLRESYGRDTVVWGRFGAGKKCAEREHTT
jgi:riboflavin-specific deaminase-like protein